MSILPSSQNQASTSSSSSSKSPSQNPNSDNGLLIFRQLQLSSDSLPQQTQTMQISNSPSSVDLSHNITGPMASTAKDSGGSSKKVNESVKPNCKRSLAHQNSGTKPSVGRGGTGSAQRSEELFGTIAPSQSQQTSGSSCCQGRTMHSAGRKTQIVNGNHLLNFRYDPISRPQPRAPPPRRQQKRKPYNKDLFLQANYKFVMLHSGNYAPDSMDPDKTLQWEDIVCVKYSTPFPVQCPICLEDPLCPQITSCGHIFCFPCILQYFLMGEEDRKLEGWKKCPLCFMMTSSKDLYTIYIENVKQHCIGDVVDFILLTRQKDSFTLSLKNKQEMDANEEMNDSFSKFTFTTDVDLSVRKAISDLDSWLARADSGLVDDLEKLPYICAAMEQLEQRKKYWNEHGVDNGNKECKYGDCQTRSHVYPPSANATNADHEAPDFLWGTLSTNVNDKLKCLGSPITNKLDGEPSLDKTAYVVEASEDQDGVLSSSYDDSKNMQSNSSGFRDRKDRDSYNFYQAVDGQHLILHPLNMKCLLRHYGSYEMLPHRISGKILQLETVTQSEAMRRRYRYLSHFSLTTTFQLCEIGLSEILPPDAFSPFMDEIKNREKQRKRVARKEREEKIKAEVAATHCVPVPFNFAQSSHDDPPTFSVDDFEALGSCPVTSSSPPTVGERKLFSNIARLGFAAGHDSPALKVEEAHLLPIIRGASDSSNVTGMRNAGTPSFANIISRAKSVEGEDVSKMNEVGKKGKKSSRVLLSTAGGRRY
ncbi:uncharacterized RING finger protein P8B7.23 [Cornus florida]|uniref:uncharacterized RING finger protein P8B7.23 n=1 Tax=Cornus florida TaxID=4283 RepID=UPI0028A1C4A1|nr:uncharacterized RING finger protein P8B7.23 [Cornus florida]